MTNDQPTRRKKRQRRRSRQQPVGRARRRTRKGGGGLVDGLKGLNDANLKSKTGRYKYLGTGDPLVCYHCKEATTWKIQSVKLGGAIADYLNIDPFTDQRYYLYTCEKCTEVRTTGSPLALDDN